MICGIVNAASARDQVGRPGCTKRRTASAMVAAVSTVTVAIRSRTGRPDFLSRRDELRTVLFAAGALRRLAAVIRVAQ